MRKKRERERQTFSSSSNYFIAQNLKSPREFLEHLQVKRNGASGVEAYPEALSAIKS